MAHPTDPPQTGPLQTGVSETGAFKTVAPVTGAPETGASVSDANLPGHACQVFAAEDVFVAQGANQGDGMTGPDEVCAGDVYTLDHAAQPLRLVLRQPGAGVQTVVDRVRGARSAPRCRPA